MSSTAIGCVGSGRGWKAYSRASSAGAGSAFRTTCTGRSISRDNLLTVYGLDETSRMADPLAAGRIFSGLICESRDARGNAVLYRYAAENGVDVAPPQAHQRPRGARDDRRRTANRY